MISSWKWVSSGVSLFSIDCHFLLLVLTWLNWRCSWSGYYQLAGLKWFFFKKQLVDFPWRLKGLLPISYIFSFLHMYWMDWKGSLGDDIKLNEHAGVIDGQSSSLSPLLFLLPSVEDWKLLLDERRTEAGNEPFGSLNMSFPHFICYHFWI